jgi:asparagine synthase (glutamine-hydrolysing)
MGDFVCSFSAGLKESFKGISFSSTADRVCEGGVLVLGGNPRAALEAYKTHNEGFAAHLDSGFPYLIYDKNKLLAAGGRFGEGQVFYDNQGVASGQQALVKGNPLNRNFLLNAVRGWDPLYGETVYEGINRLQPGEVLLWNNKGVQVKQCLRSNIISTSRRKAIRRVKALAIDLIKRLPKQPCVLLSGGVDSSLIVALLSALGRKRIHTYSIGVRGGYHETEYARFVAKKFGTHHKELMTSPRAFLEMPLLLEALEFISGAPNLPMLHEAYGRIKADGHTHVITGDGPECILGESTKYIFHSLAKHKWLRGAAALFDLARPGSLGKQLFCRLAPVAGDMPRMYLNYMQVFRVQELGDKAFSRYLLEKTRHEFIKLPRNPYNALEHMLIKNQFGSSIYYIMRKLGELSGLEVIMPFLSYRLADFGLSLPSKFKKKDKQLLLEALGHMLPKAILNREKHGFVPNAYQFLFENWELVVQLMQSLKKRSLVPAKLVDSTLRSLAPEDQKSGWRLFNLASAELFIERFSRNHK